MSRLKRVTDLFIEGKVVALGNEEDGTPILVWVKKPNSFESEEARRDGLAARSGRVLELREEDDPERLNLAEQVKKWDTDELITMRLSQEADEMWMNAVNEIRSDKEWREKLDYMERMPQLLADEGVDEEDDRSKRLAEINRDYLDAVRKHVESEQEARRKELAERSREDLEDEFYEKWRDRASIDEYMREKRVTEIWYALRDCQATGSAESGYDHRTCNHGRRLLEERREVRDLPEDLLLRVIDALDELEMPIREAGNSAAPATSSASSEPASEAEASTPSTPDETPSDAAGTSPTQSPQH